jgi:hypothetical protein
VHDDGQAASNPCQKKLSVLISYIPSCFNIQKDICKDDTHTKRREKDLDTSRYIADWMGNELKEKKNLISTQKRIFSTFIP